MIIIEIQKNNESPASVLTKTFEDKLLAEQEYHNALSHAAVSTVSAHSVVMLDNIGTRIKGETYYHE